MIVVAVDVNGKDAKFFVKAALGKESVHVFSRDEGGFSGEIVSPIEIGALEALDFFRRTIEDEAAPIVFHEQEAAVGLGKVFDSKFDEGLHRGFR